MNREWAASLLRAAVEAARGRSSFTDRVLEGLQIGAERYGDDDYCGRDNLAGALHEVRDVAAYCLMDLDELERDLEAGADDSSIGDVRMYLGEAMRLAAETDHMLQVAHERRVEARQDASLPPLRRQSKGTAP